MESSALAADHGRADEGGLFTFLTSGHVCGEGPFCILFIAAIFAGMFFIVNLFTGAVAYDTIF
jgi:hypothetical protein